MQALLDHFSYKAAVISLVSLKKGLKGRHASYRRPTYAT